MGREKFDESHRFQLPGDATSGGFDETAVCAPAHGVMSLVVSSLVVSSLVVPSLAVLSLVVSSLVVPSLVVSSLVVSSPAVLPPAAPLSPILRKCGLSLLWFRHWHLGSLPATSPSSLIVLLTPT